MEGLIVVVRVGVVIVDDACSRTISRIWFVVVVGPFYFVLTMDSVCNVCFVVIIVGTCVVVDGCSSACSRCITCRQRNWFAVAVVVVGYIIPFPFVRTMDSVCNVCFVVIVVGACIVVNGCCIWFDAVIIVIIIEYQFASVVAVVEVKIVIVIVMFCSVLVSV